MAASPFESLQYQSLYSACATAARIYEVFDAPHKKLYRGERRVRQNARQNDRAQAGNVYKIRPFEGAPSR
jgi:hypothetical protein